MKRVDPRDPKRDERVDALPGKALPTLAVNANDCPSPSASTTQKRKSEYANKNASIFALFR